MKDSYLISVVVPVYNAEKYLEKGINSILNQQYKDLQLILIDDGSTDRSGDICDKYSSFDNVIVFHKKNGGVCTARNAGIVRAEGKYITFMDSDDYFDDDSFNMIGHVLESNDIDLLDFGFHYVSNNLEKNDIINRNKKNFLFNKEYIHKKIIPPIINLTPDKTNFIFDFAAGKVFKREILLKNEICFDENRRIWEDRPFVAHYLKYCKTYYSMDKCFYNYVYVQNSLSTSFSIELLRTTLENYNIYYSLFKNEYDFETQYVNDYWANAIENIIYKQLNHKLDHPEVIDNIKFYLKNPQINYWYENRTIKNKYQIKVIKFLREKDYDKIIKVYEQQIKKDKIKKSIRKVFCFFKSCLRKLIKK